MFASLAHRTSRPVGNTLSFPVGAIGFPITVVLQAIIVPIAPNSQITLSNLLALQIV